MFYSQETLWKLSPHEDCGFFTNGQFLNVCHFFLLRLYDNKNAILVELPMKIIKNLHIFSDTLLIALFWQDILEFLLWNWRVQNHGISPTFDYDPKWLARSARAYLFLAKWLIQKRASAFIVIPPRGPVTFMKSESPFAS